VYTVRSIHSAIIKQVVERGEPPENMPQSGFVGWSDFPTIY
jgi:hypothetical protein